MDRAYLEQLARELMAYGRLLEAIWVIGLATLLLIQEQPKEKYHAKQ